MKVGECGGGSGGAVPKGESETLPGTIGMQRKGVEG